jgi:hypothetical protein
VVIGTCPQPRREGGVSAATNGHVGGDLIIAGNQRQGGPKTGGPKTPVGHQVVRLRGGGVDIEIDPLRTRCRTQNVLAGGF